MPVYTCGIWLVKQGSEDEFVDAWHDFARWTLEEDLGVGSVRLLRDRDRPGRFLSIGPWRDTEAIEQWRASAGFQEHVGRIRGLLEEFDPGTFDVAVELGGD